MSEAREGRRVVKHEQWHRAVVKQVDYYSVPMSADPYNEWQVIEGGTLITSEPPEIVEIGETIDVELHNVTKGA